MKNLLVRLLSRTVIVSLVCASATFANADTVPLRHPQGTLHGFLELRNNDGHIVASGDITQVVHGDEITSRTIFNFKDGSLDDETTVFSQHRTLHLISDHHIQKGPSFPHPTDVSIDTRNGQVTVRYEGKDGKPEVKSDRLDMPPDLANGLVPLVIENMLPNGPETTVSMLVADPKPRLVKLAIASIAEDPVAVVGSPRKATHFQIKIELGGVAGVVAPIIGKQPPDIQIWAIGGQAPTFIREQGPLYPEGPMMTIQLASPTWPEASRQSDSR
jgi:hypothetical protein